MEEQRNKVFVGGVSRITDEKKFGEYFAQYGEIEECVIMRAPETGISRGFGFVTFMHASSVAKLLAAEAIHVIDGKKLDIKIAVPRDEIGKAMPTTNRRTCKIFTGGISLDTTKSDLEEHFGQYGAIVDTTVMVDRVSGRPRGFGFVVFESEDSVDRLLQDSHEIRGRKVDCKKAVPREETADLPQSRATGWALPPVDVRDRRSSFDDRRSDPRVERSFDRGFRSPVPSRTQAYSLSGHSSGPSNYPSPTPASWEFSSSVAAFGGSNPYTDGLQAYNPYVQTAGYGAIRVPTNTTRYRPY